MPWRHFEDDCTPRPDGPGTWWVDACIGHAGLTMLAEDSRGVVQDGPGRVRDGCSECLVLMCRVEWQDMRDGMYSSSFSQVHFVGGECGRFGLLQLDCISDSRLHMPSSRCACTFTVHSSSKRPHPPQTTYTHTAACIERLQLTMAGLIIIISEIYAPAHAVHFPRRAHFPCSVSAHYCLDRHHCSPRVH